MRTWRFAGPAVLAVVAVVAAPPVASASTPAFTQVSGSPFDSGAGTTPVGPSFSPDGRLLATANNYDDKSIPGSVSVFAVGSDGALTPANGSPFATGGHDTADAAFSPKGGLLAVSNLVGPGPLDFPSVLSVFSVGAGGALTSVSGSPFAAGNGTYSLAFSPNGRLLAATDAQHNSVLVFSVAAGGALTPVPGSPFSSASLRLPISVEFSPSGRLLAVGNDATGTVSMFSVGPGGALTEVQGSPFATGPGGESVAFSPGGGLLATGNDDGTVSLFSVASDGVLTPVSGSPFSSGTGSNEVAFSSTGLLAVSNGGQGPPFDDTVSVYSSVRHGQLVAVSGSPFPTGSEPSGAAFSPDGRLLAISDAGDDTITVYRATGQGGNGQGQNDNSQGQNFGQ